jgi:hypothetical protein
MCLELSLSLSRVRVVIRYFRVTPPTGIPLTVEFRPQLVVSGLLVGIPLTVGFRPQLVVSSLLVGIPLRWDFRLSRSL